MDYRTLQKRLDKFLSDLNIGTRSQVKNFIQKGMVTVNDVIVKKPEYKVCENDIVSFQGQSLSCEEYAYYMLHKPTGIISATEDKMHQTVLDYFKDEPCKNLYPVGRLDKDTEGLLLITNDGDLGHRLLSPKHHIPKTYYVELLKPVNCDAVIKLEEGIDIGEKRLTLPAKIQKASFIKLKECLKR